MNPPANDGAAEPVARTEQRFRTLIGLATVLMLVLSWPLWVEGGLFPRVPFVSALPAPTRLGSCFFLALLVGCVFLASIGVARRCAIGASMIGLVYLVLQDQHRFQPWVYQYMMAALALATLPRGRALGLVRLFTVALYLHSGLSKFDITFCRELGASFLSAGVALLYAKPEHWPRFVRLSLIFAMPAAEVAIAVGLCFQRTRWAALAGAVAMHAALLVLLGPLGLGHSAIVLVWNAALAVEDLILFAPSAFAAELGPARISGLGRLTRLAFVLSAVLPFAERAGWIDSWPGFALYASHNERTEVFVRPDRPAGNQGEGWLRVDLSSWSRSERGVPIYPQGRACNGVAEALAGRYRGTASVRVIQWSRADRFTGARRRVEARGLEEIRRLGDRYLLNAHPPRS
jgi:hypothetical protein